MCFYFLSSIDQSFAYQVRPLIHHPVATTTSTTPRSSFGKQRMEPMVTSYHDDKRTTTSLGLFGGLFGGDDSTNVKTQKEGTLAEYTIRVKDGGTQDISVQYGSLSDYIEKWAKLFTTGELKLTTPVRVEYSHHKEGVKLVRLLFQSTNTGYQNRKEEEASKQPNDGEKKKKKAVQHGGVEIAVEQLGETELYVSAKRCNVDEDTIIKEMSEETILNELQKAIQVWKREAMK